MLFTVFIRNKNIKLEMELQTSLRLIYNSLKTMKISCELLYYITHSNFTKIVRKQFLYFINKL